MKRILLAEDDPLNVELALIALDECGLADDVAVVEDGAEALDYLFRRGGFADRQSANPVLLLLDLKMPKVDGLEVLRAVRADEQLRTLPVVILTASREPRDLAEGYRLGVNAFVVRPINFRELRAAIKNIGLFWILINEPPPDDVPKVD